MASPAVEKVFSWEDDRLGTARGSLRTRGSTRAEEAEDHNQPDRRPNGQVRWPRCINPSTDAQVVAGPERLRWLRHSARSGGHRPGQPPHLAQDLVGDRRCLRRDLGSTVARPRAARRHLRRHPGCLARSNRRVGSQQGVRHLADRGSTVPGLQPHTPRCSRPRRARGPEVRQHAAMVRGSRGHLWTTESPATDRKCDHESQSRSQTL